MILLLPHLLHHYHLHHHHALLIIMIMKRINPPSLKGLEEPEQLTLSLMRNAPFPRTPPPPIGEAPFTEASHGIDGREDLKRICGIKVVGIAFKTKKGDKSIWEHMTVKLMQHGLMIWLLLSIGDRTPH
uniref:Uncharacterized protein n=1 Tax=Opuntia streptacantha TaxID=393608 RepID=A0A7C9ES07_OPUST